MAVSAWASPDETCRLTGKHLLPRGATCYPHCMPPRLPADLDQALRTEGIPLRVVGVDGRCEYVILTSEQFERVRTIFEPARLSDQEQQNLLRTAGLRAGWDDAEMDAYDNYDTHHSADP